LLFCIFILILSYGHNGGEQKGLILLGHGFNYFVEGLFILSIVTSYLYNEWFKLKWYINISVMFITGSMLALVIILNNGISSLL